MSPDAARRLRWWFLAVAAPVAALGVLAVLLVASGVDERALEIFYDPERGTFPLRRTWLFDTAMHVGGKYLVVAGVAAALGLVLGGKRLGIDRRWASRLLYLVVCVVVTSAIAGAWKDIAEQLTPWNAARFGGKHPWPRDQEGLTLRVLLGSPGAHAASGFAWVALYFVGASLGARSRIVWLVPGLLLGALFSLTQLVRGAHPPSHQVWSIVIAWSVAWLVAVAFRWRGWLSWSEHGPSPGDDVDRDQRQQRAALPWLIAASGLFGGTIFFVLDVVTGAFEGQHPRIHDAFEAFELLLMGPGVAVTCYLLAERLRDAHERTLRRDAIERERRLQLLGRMAASVAHEVRNPLHTLRLIVDEQRLEVPGLKEHALQQEFETCLDRIDHVVDLVYRLARPGSGDSELVDLAEALRGMVGTWERNAPGGARLELEESPDHAWVHASPDGIQIVVGNLLRNASEAAPTGDTIPLTLSREDDLWVLCVRNRGSLRAAPGGAAGANDLAGKPSGLGIGLAISQQIAADAGAHITLSERHGFVRCELRWPVARGARGAQEAPA